MPNLWFQSFIANGQTPVANGNAKITLYTFHHAGGACQFFQPWAAKLPNNIELISVQLPGRWNRMQEKAFLQMSELTPILGAEFKKQLAENPQQRFAFYGHSLGGLVAYELTRYLMEQHLQLPLHLFISSKRALQITGHNLPIYHLSDPEFETIVTELYGALPATVAEDLDMKAMFLAITKKDMELLDTHEHILEPIINVPMTILNGSDDHVITMDTITDWKHLTSSTCEILEFPGAHFFLRSPESEEAVLQVITSRLDQYLK